MAGDSEAWMAIGLCRQVDCGDMFFPERGCGTEEAKRVCMRCDVREPCLQFALDHDEKFGVWGAASEHQRRRMRRGEVVSLTRKKAPKPCGECGGDFVGSSNQKYCGAGCRSLGLSRVRRIQQAKRKAS